MNFKQPGHCLESVRSIATASASEAVPVGRSYSDVTTKGDVGGKVEFAFHERSGKVEQDRKKYLTAKYGQHQMALIRKRLIVEFWLAEEMQLLYPYTENVEECEIDLDEVMDCDTDDDRRRYLKMRLANCRQSAAVVLRFIEDLVFKAKSL